MLAWLTPLIHAPTFGTFLPEKGEAFLFNL